EAVGSDRCGVTQDIVIESSGDLATKIIEEWCREGIGFAVDVAPNSFPQPNIFPIKGDFLKIHQTLRHGEVVNFHITDLSGDEKAFLEAQGNTAMLIVPIMVQGKIWGSMGFDNCGEPRLYDEAEISILKVAAESIAAAITRQAQEDSVREAEERYRNLIELSTEGIYRLEFDEPISRDLPIREQVALFYKSCYGAEANDAFAKMYGYQTAEEMIGWRLTDIHVEASEQNIEFLSALASDPNFCISNSESEELDVSGNVHYFLNNAVGIVEDNKLVRIWGTQTDITELKQAQKASEEAEKAILEEREKAARDRATKLAEANEAIGQTLSALATNPEPDSFLCSLLLELSKVTGSCNTALFLYDAETNTLSRHIAVQDGQAYTGRVPRDLEMFQEPFPADITGGWQAVIDSPQPLTFEDLDLPASNSSDFWWNDSIAWHINEGHREVACARMKVGDVPLGFIGFSFRDRSNFSPEQLEFIQALTNQATLSIQLTRLAEEAKQTAVLQEQEKAAQQRAAQLSRSNKALKRSLDLLATQPELEAFLQGVVNEAVAQTGAVSGHLFLHDADIDACWLHVSTDNNGDWRSVPDMQLWLQPTPVSAAPLFWEKIFERKAFAWEDMQSSLKPGPHIWEPSIAWHLQRGHTSTICAPLVLGDQVIGFLGLPFIGETAITQEEIELAQALTNQATLAIQFTRLADKAKQTAILQEQEKAARDRATELAKANEAIGETLSALTTTPELDEFLGQILCKINEPIGACKANLFLYDEETNTLRQYLSVHEGIAYQGVAPGEPEMFRHPIPADLSPAWERISNSPKPWTLDESNPKDADLWWQDSMAWHQAEGHRAATCAPMRVGGNPVGFIGFAFRNYPILTDEQLEFIQALTNQATLAVQLTRLAEQTQTAALSAALNNERTRLAREIHDTLAQSFTGVSLQLEAVRSLTAKLTHSTSAISSLDIAQLQKAQTYILRARDLARKGLSEARRSVSALRSEALETDTLTDALRKILDQTTRDTGLKTQFHLLGEPCALADDLQLNLLRIAQEAVTNVLRHAQATELSLTLAMSPSEICLQAIDDGIGFEVSSLDHADGFGLVGIRERSARFGGQLHIISSPHQGTTLEVVLPCRDYSFKAVPAV
ncbi:MAG: GAF domain-containing protein, partial [Cyanobacteria bacterium J06576_12]